VPLLLAIVDGHGYGWELATRVNIFDISLMKERFNSHPAPYNAVVPDKCSSELFQRPKEWPRSDRVA